MIDFYKLGRRVSACISSFALSLKRLGNKAKGAHSGKGSAPKGSGQVLYIGGTESAPASLPVSANAKPVEGELSPEFQGILDQLKKTRFRFKLFCGVDETDVWRRLIQLNSMYEKALIAERARYNALLEQFKSGQGIDLPTADGPFEEYSEDGSDGHYSDEEYIADSEEYDSDGEYAEDEPDASDPDEDYADGLDSEAEDAEDDPGEEESSEEDAEVSSAAVVSNVQRSAPAGHKSKKRSKKRSGKGGRR